MLQLENSRIHSVSIVRNLDYIIEFLESVLDNARLLHSIGTYHASIHLAPVLEVDAEPAAIGGLVHDSARGWSCKRIKEILEDSGNPPPLEDIPYPRIWHAQLGASMLKTKFEVDDEGLAAAIRVHSTGAPGMSRLDKLLFIADYIEPTRSFEGVDSLRRLVYKDWEKAFRVILREKIDHVRNEGERLHPRAIEALRYYGNEEG